MRASNAQPAGPRFGRRALLSLLCLALASGAAVLSWPLEPRLNAAAAAATHGDARLLVLAGLLVASATACCGLVSRVALRQTRGTLGRTEVCARYGVGSLVKSFAPAKLGDAVRIGLLLKALPAWRRKGIARCFVSVQGARMVVLARLVLGAALPDALGLVAVALVASGLALLGRGARLLLALAVLAPVAKVAATAVLLSALGAPAPLQAAFPVVPALELAALLPLTPGNIGLASTAVAVALRARLTLPAPAAVQSLEARA